MSFRQRSLTLPILWLLAIVSLLAMLTFYRLSSMVNNDGWHRVDTAFDSLTNLDLAINLDILKLRQRQKLDYDDLVSASRQIDEHLRSLEPDFRLIGLGSALVPLRDTWRDKLAAIEQFKQTNSVFSTAQFHFVRLSEELHRRQNSPLLNSVSRRLHAFLMQGGSNDLAPLLATIYQLDSEITGWPEESRASGKLLVMQGTLILSHYRRMQQMSHDLLESPFALVQQKAYLTYADLHRKEAAAAEKYQKIMAAFGVLLAACVVLALLELSSSVREAKHSHDLLDKITDNLGEGILAFDAHHRLQFVNQQALSLLGRRREQLTGLPGNLVLFGGVDGLTPPPVLHAITAGAVLNEDGWVATPGGRLPVAFRGAPLPVDQSSSQGSGYVLSFRDLSQEREAQARLDLASHVFESLSEAMMITNRKGHIQFINRAFTEITGFSEEEALGRKPGDFLASGRHDDGFFKGMWQALHQTGQWQGEIFNRRKNGEGYTEWLSISAIRDASGQIQQYIGLFSDISDRKEAEAYIHHLAYHDPLTGLANRLLFRDRLDTAMRQAQRNGRPLAVLMFDLDRFKVINDTLGHPAGDTLLIEVAQRIGNAIRDCDTLARLGGDEFALLMPEINDASDCAVLAGKMLEVLAPSMFLAGKEVFITSSIGIAVHPDHGNSGEQLLRNADVALYTAKNAGRNAWRLFNASGDAESGDRLELEAALRHAISRQELLLHYQPQIEAESGRLSGVEALIRWQLPERGLIPPDRFIPLAEQTGLISEIGAWCMETACQQLARWQEEGTVVPRVAVNVSARQLRAIGFAEHVLLTVRKAGLQPTQLELELTESMLSEDPERTTVLFAELREAGVRIAIDDFGTGYSSLNYLAQYPVDVLKIDRSFVNNLGGDAESAYVVRAIIMLAQGMKMETVAEGVETEAQRAQLAELGCAHLQGYLLSRPRPAADISELVERFNTPAPARH